MNKRPTSHAKVLSITNHQGNASPNPGERPPHTHRDRQQVPATCTGGGDPVRWCSGRGRGIAAPQKANTVLPFPPALRLLATNAKGLKAGPWTAICTPVFTAAGGVTVAKRRTQPVSMDGWMNCSAHAQWNIIHPSKGMKFLSHATAGIPRRY